ncbi:MAG TPA: carbohydrate ABC transporter permease [Firmicutes bacterium]|nr:carbohydrate ABC transporter permease [Bacillota bacterium]
MAKVIETIKMKTVDAPWFLIYRRKSENIFVRLLMYTMLINIAYIFLYPVFYMISTSMMTIDDFVDPAVYWIPRTVNWANFTMSLEAMRYWYSLGNSTYIALLSAVGQLVSCAMAGYGFGRIKFPGREFLFMLVIFTFIVPPQTIIVPLFILYKNLGWIDTYNPFVVPSFFAHGLRGSLFILIFRQFFRRQPWELEDAARVDGCGALRTFATIFLPLAKPALLVVFLFSVVWHWNDFYEPTMYLMKPDKYTVPLRLSILSTSLQEVMGGSNEFYNEPLVMAACFLVVLPPLLLYIFAQRHFTESVERTGLVD